MHSVRNKKLNRSLSAKIVDARIAHVFNTHEEVLVTSSFGTTSAVLLHLVSRIEPGCPIYFIDTGYHFEETLQYRNRLCRLLGLNLKVLHPEPKAHKMTQNQQLWSSDPDRCCAINKVAPLQEIKEHCEVWVSGLLGFQNSYRNALPIVDGDSAIIKFYPLIDWNSTLAEKYITYHGLPQHPLKEKGYASIGCTHCTVPATGREGRWYGQSKTECGLHR